MEAGKVDVTVHSNTSITIYWKDDLIKKYVCYSAEWMTKGHEAQCKSFYENKHNHRTLSPLPGAEIFISSVLSSRNSVYMLLNGSAKYGWKKT